MVATEVSVVQLPGGWSWQQNSTGSLVLVPPGGNTESGLLYFTSKEMFVGAGNNAAITTEGVWAVLSSIITGGAGAMYTLGNSPTPQAGGPTHYSPVNSTLSQAGTIAGAGFVSQNFAGVMDLRFAATAEITKMNVGSEISLVGTWMGADGKPREEVFATYVEVSDTDVEVQIAHLCNTEGLNSVSTTAVQLSWVVVGVVDATVRSRIIRE